MAVATKTTPAVQEPVAAPDPGFRRLGSQTLELSKAKAVQAARDHAALPASPTERTRELKRVKELVDRIKGGVFLPCSWATVVFEGTKYRMNGQHSSESILEAADYLPDVLAVHIDHYEADDSQAMALLFRQFDARFSGRSKQDVAGAYHGLVHELENVSRGRAKLAIEGIAWYERSIERLPVPGGDAVYEMFFRTQYHPFVRWINGILSVKTPELHRAPIVGAMYATFLASESGAQDFWSHVAKQDLPDDSDARSVLSGELVKIKEDGKEVKSPAPGEFYAKCVKAWNAYRNGDKIRSLNVNTKKGIPEVAA